MSATGYFYQADSLGGIVFVKTSSLSTDSSHEILVQSPAGIRNNEMENKIFIHPNRADIR